MKKKLILKNKYFVVATIISIVVCLSIVFVASYAFFTTRTETKEFVIYTGTLEVNHQKSNNTIDLINLKPVIDSEGLNTEPHTFTVTNNGTMDARYLVRLELDKTIGDLVPLEYVKISYSINNGSYSDPVLLSDLSSNLSFYKSNTLAVNSLDTISLKIWIDLNAPNEIANKQFKARIVVDSIQDVDDGFVVDTAPIIHLNKDSNGNYDLVLPIGSTYTELGVLSVEDDKDNISVSSVNTTYQFFNGIDVVDIESINMNNAGVYYVVYTVSDSYGNIGRSVRQVFVSNDKNIPSISLKGNSSVDIYLNSTYTESGVNYDSNNRLLTFGSVDTTKLGTYIIKYIVIDNNGNMNSVTRTVNVIVPTCEYEPGQTWNFAYTGDVQEWTVPIACSGLYKLEVYGAQGGNAMGKNTRVYGGAGGKSSGYVLLNENEKLYIVCGENGQTVTSGSTTAAYNGGGRGVCGANGSGEVGGGGGATHIAKVPGTLASIGYDSFVTYGNGLIVAGGGSGAVYGATFNKSVRGYSGGGTNGEDSSTTSGTQTGGYAFGVGMDGNPGAFTLASGAGGGFYGGFAPDGNTTVNSGAGGSGYIGGVPSITFKGTVYSPTTVTDGNIPDSYDTVPGKATITLIDLN